MRIENNLELWGLSCLGLQNLILRNSGLSAFLVRVCKNMGSRITTFRVVDLWSLHLWDSES